MIVAANAQPSQTPWGRQRRNMELELSFPFSGDMCVIEVCAFRSRFVGEQRRFNRWFGNSRIVNEDGTPKVVYHGTSKDFSALRPKKRNPELGFHFGTLSQAEFFAGVGSENRKMTLGFIMPVYLRIENPLRIYDVFERGRRSAENVAHWLYRDGVFDIRVRERIYCARSAHEACHRVTEAIEAVGYDGLIYPNEWAGGSATSNEDSYVAFRPEQIKSVFNRGTFDRSSADLLA